MKNGKIYWVKQKLSGLVLLLISIVCFDLFIKEEIALLLLVTIPMGLLLLLTKKRLFVKDYIFDVREFLK